MVTIPFLDLIGLDHRQLVFLKGPAENQPIHPSFGGFRQWKLRAAH